MRFLAEADRAVICGGIAIELSEFYCALCFKSRNMSGINIEFLVIPGIEILVAVVFVNCFAVFRIPRAIAAIRSI
jgi:hypothetical protein